MTLHNLLNKLSRRRQNARPCPLHAFCFFFEEDNSVETEEWCLGRTARQELCHIKSASRLEHGTGSTAAPKANDHQVQVELLWQTHLFLYQTKNLLEVWLL